MTKQQRIDRLLLGGIPRYVRCYDNGGGGATIDRFTVVYTGNYKGRNGICSYVLMNARPFHPQGFGQHGASSKIIDAMPGCWAGPSIGKSCHLGKRIPFAELPP